MNRPLAKLTAMLVAGVVLLIVAVPAIGADKENCLMCHKYPFLGRVDSDGKRHNYHVDEALFERSLHRTIECRECHTYITKFPHDPVTEKVNCANRCHMKPPHAEAYFSHSGIVNTFGSSIHAAQADDPPNAHQGKPDCKYCHRNPIYAHVEEVRIDFETTLRRCINCHLKEGITPAYRHVVHRLRHKTSRSPQDIVALCAQCHADEALMAKFNPSKKALKAVKSYQQSIHGKKVALGSQAAADCISCHASAAIHDIFKKDDQRSTVNTANLEATCKQCHVQTGPRFIQIAVHPSMDPETNPLLFLMSIVFKMMLYGTVFGLLGMMLLETFGRKRDGLKWQIRRGTTWRGTRRRRKK